MKKTIIILHGWGLFGQKYKALQKILEKKGYQVLSLDFPGFGSEPLIKPVMVLDDYVEFLYTFYKKHKITKAFLIAHSFGGRVAAKFAVKYPRRIEKIILTGSPLIRQKLSLKKSLVQFFVSQTKRTIAFLPAFITDYLRWGIYRFIGEWDYYKAKDLREIFKNIIHEDASLYLQKIKSPVLVLWGEKDKIVPNYIGKQIAQKIPNAKYTTITDGGHGIPYTHPKEFAQQILNFINT